VSLSATAWAAARLAWRAGSYSRRSCHTSMLNRCSLACEDAAAKQKQLSLFEIGVAMW
jgi:hypothetical protein